MNLMNICAQLPPMVHFIIIAVVFIWEYVLGKTKFGSTVGLFIEHPLMAIWSWIDVPKPTAAMVPPKDPNGPK